MQKFREGELPISLGRCYWVEPEKLLAGSYPGDRIRALLQAGIRCFVDLTHELDVDYNGNPLAPYSRVMKDIADSAGIECFYHRCQIIDEDVPSKQEMRNILDIIDSSIARDHPVYVHCWGGRGRTGTVVGCWLARHGISNGEAVLATIRELRRKRSGGLDLPSPAVPEQREFVLHWKIGE
jgi:hypothetical protein